MSKLVRVVIGVVAIAASLGAFGPIAAAWLSAALMSVGASLLSSAAMEALAKTPGRHASETSLQLGEVPRQVIFGKAVTGGSLLDAFNYGGKYGTDWEVLLIALADHECESLEGFYVNDAYVPFAGSGVVSGYSSQLEVHFLPGNATQAWPSFVTTYGSGWTATDNCKGVACVAVAYKADKPDAKNPAWPGGRPRFLFVVKGKRCYQARKDSTVAGGAGTHRWDAPTTWEWTDNAAECRYQFQRGIFALDQVDKPEMLLLGRGLSAIEAPPENSIVSANTCDEPVALAVGGTEKRYTFNGIIGADEDFLTAEGYFAAATGGIIRQPDGGIEVEPGQAKATVAEITDLDILNLAEITVDQIRGEADNEWINTVAAQYVAPSQKWKMHAAPVRRVYADVIADGGPRTNNLTLKQVTSGTQAQRLAEIVRRLGRLPTTAGLTLGPRFVELEEGDWIGWTSARHFGGARKVFRIESYGRNEKWHIALQLREIAASVYGWTADDERADGAVATPNPVPDSLGTPDPLAWALYGGQVEGVSGKQPALIVIGAVDYDFATAVRFEYRLAGSPDWTDAGTHAPSTTRKEITGVADGADYEVAVSYIVDGIPGDQLLRGPVTAGALSTGSAAHRLAAKSVTFPVTSDDTSITVSAFTGVLDDGRTIVFPSATLGSLASDTIFGLFYDIAAATYSAVPSPATAEMADAGLVFIQWVQTSSGGVFSGGETPPGGYGGSGGAYDNVAF